MANRLCDATFPFLNFDADRCQYVNIVEVVGVFVGGFGRLVSVVPFVALGMLRYRGCHLLRILIVVG